MGCVSVFKGAFMNVLFKIWNLVVSKNHLGVLEQELTGFTINKHLGCAKDY